MGTHPIFESDFDCLTELKMSAGDAKIGQPAPAFSAQALVNGEFKNVSLADYKGKYVVLFFYPLDFTFVCPTEIIARNGTLRQITINDLPVGRSVDETLRLVQAFQFVDENGEVCPAGWKPGSDSMKADPKGSKAYFSKQ